MAASNKELSIVLALMFLVNVMAMVSCTSRIIAEIDEDDDDNDDNDLAPAPADKPPPRPVSPPPAPAPDVSECSMRLSVKCGAQVFFSIFWADSSEPCPTCCRELVSMGRDCNDELMFIGLAERKNGTAIITRNNFIWKTCVAKAKETIPDIPADISPYPLP